MERARTSARLPKRHKENPPRIDTGQAWDSTGRTVWTNSSELGSDPVQGAWTRSRIPQSALCCFLTATRNFFCVGVRGQYIRYAPTKHGRAVVWPFPTFCGTASPPILGGAQKLFIVFHIEPRRPWFGPQ